MSKSNEPYAVQPEGSTTDEEVIGGPSPDSEFAETMHLRFQQDQQLASSRDHLKRSAKRLLNLLEMDAPSNMVCRELALITQRVGTHHNCLLDLSAP